MAMCLLLLSTESVLHFCLLLFVRSSFFLCIFDYALFLFGSGIEAIFFYFVVCFPKTACFVAGTSGSTFWVSFNIIYLRIGFLGKNVLLLLKSQAFVCEAESSQSSAHRAKRASLLSSVAKAVSIDQFQPSSSICEFCGARFWFAERVMNFPLTSPL
ncbi:hypothetical protein L1987_33396 [Smallanthus sonchifolius]|uniref:Uncharacterized protein n=1 Tax=Smallanthus sonchifolius TaxID=185202 RepID=A0ACB9HQN9_9ASTR|nr:hypothetical protein L1987_33396 [Smallanthus sonchifolius]